MRLWLIQHKQSLEAYTHAFSFLGDYLQCAGSYAKLLQKRISYFDAIGANDPKSGYSSVLTAKIGGKPNLERARSECQKVVSKTRRAWRVANRPGKIRRNESQYSFRIRHWKAWVDIRARLMILVN